MPYQADISRDQPSLLVFLIDQSASMSDPIASQPGVAKKDSVADALNRLLVELAFRCTAAEGVRNWFYIAVIGYGAGEAGSALRGPLAKHDINPISDLVDNPYRLEKRMQKLPDGAGGLVEHEIELAIWLEPVANGSTPMCQALLMATELVRLWIRDHPRNYPPIVLNLTDGEANDGDPLIAANQLLALGSDDGQTLLFNLHVSDAATTPITFPDTDAALPDAYSRMLFEMSSVLPSTMVAYAAKQGYLTSERTRGFVYNSDFTSMVHFLDVGTKILPVLR
jgi:hypothetical protein